MLLNAEAPPLLSDARLDLLRPNPDGAPCE